MLDSRKLSMILGKVIKKQTYVFFTNVTLKYKNSIKCIILALPLNQRRHYLLRLQAERTSLCEALIYEPHCNVI